MKTLIMALLLSLSIACEAQVTMPIGSPPAEKTLVGKETWVVKSGESSFRFITANDSVAYWIRSRFEKDWTIKSMSYVQKKDRHGTYWERSFYFKNEEWDNVVSYLEPKLRRL